MTTYPDGNWGAYDGAGLARFLGRTSMDKVSIAFEGGVASLEKDPRVSSVVSPPFSAYESADKIYYHIVLAEPQEDVSDMLTGFRGHTFGGTWGQTTFGTGKDLLTVCFRSFMSRELNRPYGLVFHQPPKQKGGQQA